jgi:chemotaxis methyl-accepting protein methylase
MNTDAGPVPVIGIGASAGGLEALERFLASVPVPCGHAFVVVQHQDPERVSLLGELLRRVTPLTVVEATDAVPIVAETVYVMPADHEITIGDGVLQLVEPADPRGLRLPIDRFFTALGAERQREAVGVLLSGMGADGTVGLAAIKAHGGATFVQDPATARFADMPRSAVENGVADVVATADELYPLVVAYLQSTRDARLREPLHDAHPVIDAIVSTLRQVVGHDFSQYKRSTLARRIQRRISLHHLPSVEAYEQRLRDEPAEARLLFAELLIGVTSFFRDTAVWTQLREEIFPELIRQAAPGATLRAWIAGCSTGEEAYSLAIVFLEALAAIAPHDACTLQIFATDLDRDAIARARTGTYPESIADEVSAERRQRFFTLENGRYRVNSRVREMVIFAPHNVTIDPPFTKLDLLSCRNLLIYLTPPLQQKLMALFHFSLKPGGVLMLGSAETAGPSLDRFTPIAGKGRLYRRLTTTPASGYRDLPPVFIGGPTDPPEPMRAPLSPPLMNLQHVTERTLLDRFTPPAVLIGDEGDILFVSGKTGRYLEPAAGQANWNIFAMARPGLGLALTEGCQRVRREQRPVTLQPLAIDGDHGGIHYARVTIEPVAHPESTAALLMIVFQEIPPPASEPAARRRGRGTDAQLLQALEEELRQARENLRVAREEMQISQEELRSTNEELQSTNEELQSTNEELTTSKEEMQSMNEELQTVNHELRAKVDELMLASSDMTNLLNSLDIATLFLDSALNVRRFTTKTASLIKLIPSDVGRPITDIVSSLEFADMAADAQEVLRSVRPVEKEVASRDGRWYAARIMPYRMHDDRIDGVVITFTDITKAKQLEAELRERRP